MKKIIQLFACFFVLVSIETTAQTFSTHKGDFRDSLGRTIYFRGINLSGSSKLPVVSNTNRVSFVGRPFPINEADEHFERLQQWGFNFIRLIITWEALEHDGPVIYDYDYINYIKTIVKKAGEYGLYIMIDAHQDVWSRFTGGDGAPLWTLEKTGFNIQNFNDTNAALVFNPADDIPPMIWPTNYSKLASATMFTLFFGGNDFAAKTIIEGENIQNYLQRHYINAFANLAKHLKEEKNVIGFEVMNEPHPGYIGHKDLTNYTTFPLRNKATPTPIESMQLGAGYSLDVANWKVGLLGIEEDGVISVNTKLLSAWKHDSLDVWKNNGVWNIDNNKIEIDRADYFYKINNKEVDFSGDYYKPFIYNFTRAIRNELPETLIFIEKPFSDDIPEINDLDNIVNATHWYDQITLIKKLYFQSVSLDLATGSPVFGADNIDALFTKQTKSIKDLTLALGNNAPTIIGEIGIPFDLADGRAYNKNLFTKQRFVEQNLALDRSLRAMESNQLNYAIWNYTPDNNNLIGDLWNKEDLSIYSPDQKEDLLENDINNGGRALRAAVRPFASAVSGRITNVNFDFQTGRYTLEFDSSDFTGSQDANTVLILPNLYFEDGFSRNIIGGELVATDNNMIWHFKSDSQFDSHKVVLTPLKSLNKIKLSGLWYIPLFILFLCLDIIVIKILKRNQRIRI